MIRGFAEAEQNLILTAIDEIAAAAPFRRMATPGGLMMSVAMTSCGGYGWISDRAGYRYSAIDPLSALPWPAMPGAFAGLASRIAEAGGYPRFRPNSCLINRYLPGARMSLHQDRQEDPIAAPVVSVSLGLSAVFLWGGRLRSDRPQRLPLHHADAVVWGRESRLNFHGIAPLKPGLHPLVGSQRYNLTFRMAGG